MKSTFKEERHQYEQEYPCAKIFNDGSFVVLFTKPETGFVIASGDVGEMFTESNGWVEENFRPFKGLIKIEF